MKFLKTLLYILILISIGCENSLTQDECSVGQSIQGVVCETNSFSSDPDGYAIVTFHGYFWELAYYESDGTACCYCVNSPITDIKLSIDGVSYCLPYEDMIFYHYECGFTEASVIVSILEYKDIVGCYPQEGMIVSNMQCGCDS